MSKVSDEVPAIVSAAYSNLVSLWCAELTHSETGEVLAYAMGDTRADSLRGLADEIEETL